MNFTSKLKRISNSGSALMQAMVTVAMVAFISYSMLEYQKLSSNALSFSESDAAKVGVGEIFNGVFKSSQYCNAANIDLDTGSGFNNSMPNQAALAIAITNKIDYKMQVKLPHFDSSSPLLDFPLTPAQLPNDPLLDDFGLTLGSLTMRFTRDLGGGNSYEAEVTGGFISRKSAGSATYTVRGNKKIATLVINRDPITPTNFKDCIGQGTASDFCQNVMGCNYLIPPGGSPSCVCGVSNAACAADEILDGFDAAGNPLCVPYSPRSCPSGQYLVRINSNGSLDCRDWPYDVCNIGPGTLTWNDGVTVVPPNCSNDFTVVIPAGETRPISDINSATDATAGTSGRAYAYCPYATSGSPNPVAYVVADSFSTPRECVNTAAGPPPPVDCYTDSDSDGFGVGAPISRVSCNAGEALVAGDCCDSDANAHPGQVTYFGLPRTTCGGFDYDCNGTDDHDTSITPTNMCSQTVGGPRTITSRHNGLPPCQVYSGALQTCPKKVVDPATEPCGTSSLYCNTALNGFIYFFAGGCTPGQEAIDLLNSPTRDYGNGMTNICVFTGGPGSYIQKCR